ncbi:DHA1 family inner membrane transport protein [Sphingomonas sp. BK036]|uniref:MFS transporter n=1 Tax=Sphingomonas sp. BK036 TaxID=2512122 RepID=UPI001028FE3C|nr:MFS transporter [Sphingomonas sp. BK036]RZT57002.1 DHA1 family inner membrane transport protein [Sphingomonas sp. BK036]
MTDSYGPTTVNPRLALLALAVGGFAIGTTEFAAMSLLPQFARGLGIDEPTAGHVISAYALGVVVGAPMIAVLAAKIERRVLLIGLMTFLGIANGLSALAPTYHLMLLARFLSGLPHGAYFGVGSLVAASMVPRGKRSRAVSRMMLGLTIATIAGVPLANGIGQWFGWRWGFGIVAIIAAVTVAMLVRFAPILRPAKDASPLGELAALRNGQVWLTLAIGAVGFGGIFCVYTYLASTLTEVTGVSSAFTPVAFALFGVGMTIGTLVCAKAADVALMPAAGITLLFGAGALALYAPAAPHLWAILPVVLLIGCGGGLSTILQTRLMDVAEEAQTLAAALNHSAFNTANAIGPWLGGLAIAGGFGLPSTGWVGTALALGGFAIWALSWALDRRRA